MDFLTVTYPAQGMEIAGQWITRPRYGLHLRLGKLSEEIMEAIEGGDGQKAAALIASYFSLSGLDTIGLSGVGQLACLTPLLELNQIKMLFAFQKEVSEKLDKPPYDYDGRNWAWWVHKLATRYGWTAEYIFNLWPEEVAAYLQEIIIAEYDELDEKRRLSEIGWTYNKATKEYNFHPTPRPSWIIEDKKKLQLRRIRRDMLPVGNVIRLDEKSFDSFEIIN